MKFRDIDLPENCDHKTGMDGFHTIPYHPTNWGNVVGVAITTLALLPIIASAQLHRCSTEQPTAEQLARTATLIQGTAVAADILKRNVYIPVAFHVVHSVNGEGNISDSMIQRQVEVLNASFNSRGFFFQLAGVDRIANDDWFRNPYPHNAVDAAMKGALAVDPVHTLNIYSVGFQNSLLGYAYFPDDYQESNKMHGVVCLHSSLPGGAASPYNEGDTAVHEVGHYLGLYHTFQGGCNGSGDYVADTPSEESPAFGCPGGRDSCSGQGQDPIHNFMDYSNDACMFEFTPGQGDRMKTMVSMLKPGLMINPPFSPAVNVIYVDRSFTGLNPNGSETAPFPTIGLAFSAAKDGDTMRIRSGDYSISQGLGGKAVRFESENGTVRIGYTPSEQPTSLSVDAGPDLIVPVGNGTNIPASAQLVNTGPVTSWHWEKVNGPGSVLSQNYDERDFKFWVTSSGAYELRVAASNGQFTTSDVVRVTFQEPVLKVDAGRNQDNVPFPGTVMLAGVVQADGVANPEVSIRWRPSSGPQGQTAYIASPNSLSSSVSVTGKGIYRFALEAWFRGRYRRDVVTVGFGVQIPPNAGREDEEVGTREPYLELTALPNNARRLTILSPEDLPCMLQRSTNLVDWSDWMTVNPLRGVATATDTTSPTSFQFYRATMR